MDFPIRFRLASSRSPDDRFADNLRVTVVATGLGMAAARQPKPQLVLSNAPPPSKALQQSGVDNYDIPALLTKQAD